MLDLIWICVLQKSTGGTKFLDFQVISSNSRLIFKYFSWTSNAKSAEICELPKTHFCKNLKEINNFELTLPTPFISESCIRIKTNANFYFQTSLWCLKRFYEGLNFLFSSRIGTRRVNKCTKLLPQIKILQKRETSLHGLLKNLNILTVQLHLPKILSI